MNRKRGNAGSLCIKHGMLKVSHYITLHHIVSVNSIHTCIYTTVVLAPFQCFIPISAFYPRLSPFRGFILTLAFHPQFRVLSSFQCFIPISVFYPHFSVVSPFQCFIPISAFYRHFNVLSPFQRCIPISVFYPTSVQGLRGETVTKTLVKFILSFQNFVKKIACAVPFQPFSFSVLSRPPS